MVVCAHAIGARSSKAGSSRVRTNRFDARHARAAAAWVYGAEIVEWLMVLGDEVGREMANGPCGMGSVQG
jgi:hypothetical protein